jgi:hypothetical protein
MDDDQNIPAAPVAEVPTPAPEPVPTPVEAESSQPNGSTPTDLPPEAPESTISVPAPIPVESQNGGVNQPESEVPEAPNQAAIPEPIQSVPAQSAPSAPAAQTPQAPQPQPPIAPQPQSPAQQNQTGFIRVLLAKAQAKIQSNKQKKLELLMQTVSKNGTIDNREAQKLLRISDKTAERYLTKLVAQGRLKRAGAGRDVVYTL